MLTDLERKYIKENAHQLPLTLLARQLEKPTEEVIGYSNAMLHYHGWNDKVVMPFGMHKGKELGHIPLSYLRWLLRESTISGPLRQAVVAIIEEWEHNEGRNLDHSGLSAQDM